MAKKPLTMLVKYVTLMPRSCLLVLQVLKRKVSGMKILRLVGSDLVRVQEEHFAYEREIQSLVEQNVETLFGLKFVSREFSVESCRLDTLCFDEKDKSFVIIEYKKASSESVMDQGFSYLTAMENNKAGFILEYNEKLSGKLKIRDVNWDSSRIIFISSSFTERQINSAKYKKANFELWVIKKFSNDLYILNPTNPVHDRPEVDKGRADPKVSKPKPTTSSHPAKNPGSKNQRVPNKPRMTFSELGICPGSLIAFHKKGSIKAEVIDDRRVRFEEETMYLGHATLKVMQKHFNSTQTKPPQGAPYWVYKNEQLSKRRARLLAQHSNQFAFDGPAPLFNNFEKTMENSSINQNKGKGHDFESCCHFTDRKDESYNLWRSLGKMFHSLPEISFEDKKVCVSLKKKNDKAICFIHPRKNSLKVRIVRGQKDSKGNLSKGFFNLKDPNSLAVSKQSKDHSGRTMFEYWIEINYKTNLDDVMFLIKQKYDSFKKSNPI